jgi:hypothetical protein
MTRSGHESDWANEETIRTLTTKDLNRWIILGANIAVLIGIVFVALELRQNNELMAAEARFNRVTVSRDAWQAMAENGDYANLLVRARRGEELSETDEFRAKASNMRYLVNMDWIYRELPVDSAERNYMRQSLISASTNPVFLRVWAAEKTHFSPAFVEWVEQEILAD